MMGLRSKGKQLSFEILSSPSAASVNGTTDWTSDSSMPLINGDDDRRDRDRRKRKHKKPKKKKNKSLPDSPINPILEDDRFSQPESPSDQVQSNSQSYTQSFVQQESVSTVFQVLYAGELRQRSVNGVVFEESHYQSQSQSQSSPVVENEKEKENVRAEVITRPNPKTNDRLETAESLDWKRFTADDATYPLSVENPPIKYFMEEIDSGYSLRSTTTPGNEKERERVYDTIFRLPWRCELLIDVGFFVCFNSFLSLLTIIPMRALMTLWRLCTGSSESLLQRSCQILAASSCFLVD